MDTSSYGHPAASSRLGQPKWNRLIWFDRGSCSVRYGVSIRLRSHGSASSSFFLPLLVVMVMDGISGTAASCVKEAGRILVQCSSITTTSSSEDTVLHETNDNITDLVYARIPPTSEQVLGTVHTEFGHCANESYRCVSQYNPDNPVTKHEIEEPPYYILITTYISYLILLVFGHLRDSIGKRCAKQYFMRLMPYPVRALCDGSPCI